jgi:hypothetical protein
MLFGQKESKYFASLGTVQCSAVQCSAVGKHPCELHAERINSFQQQHQNYTFGFRVVEHKLIAAFT